jgi:hypothetical protein
MMRWIRVGALPAIVFGFSFCLRFLALTQTSFANGWDGYFYINQVRAFFEEGKMHVPDVSFVYALLIAGQYFINDYVLTYKIIVSVIAGGFSLSLFVLAKKWSRNAAIPLVVAAFTVFSPHLTYFAAQYPKNLLGGVFFLWLLYAVRPEMKWLSLPVFILNFFGHRLTSVLSFVYLICFYLVKRLNLRIIAFASLTMVIVVAGASLLPGILNVFDVKRLEGIFSASPHFAPVSFLSTFGELVSPFWKIEIIFLVVVYVCGLILVVKERRTSDASLLSVAVVLSILIFPFFHWSLEGPAFRFVLMFLLLTPVLLIFSGDRWLNSNPYAGKHVAIAISIILFGCSFVSYKTYIPARHDPPYALYSRIGETIKKNKEGNTYELIIAHKSLAEYIVYATHVEAMSWIPEYNVDKGKLWRVAYGVRLVQWEFYLEESDRDNIRRLTPSYWLVREDVWQRFLINVARDGNAELLNELSGWKNPARKRPDYL